jgi:aerobic carbon-monoxide dehydrogenase medium subunit
MKPAPFRYHAPRTIDEAIGLLDALEDARLLAGGQSLVPMLNFRVVQPAHIIDINRVEGLSYIRRDGDVLEMGAMTRQRDVEFSDVVRDAFPLMHAAVQHIGHRQTRNRGTVGGSLCHLDPSAELVTVAAAVDAIVVVASKAGRREIRFADFPLGLMSAAIEANELVTAVRFPLWRRGHGFAFEEFARRHGDFALASVAVLLEVEHGRVARASVTVGGLDSRPQRPDVKLEGRDPSAALFDEVARACNRLDAMTDAHVDGGYRKRVAHALVLRALGKAYGRVAQS